MAITKAEPGKTRIGWIGTGVMGRWMCQHAMTKGYAATVYNRSKDKAQPLREKGAKWAATPTWCSPSSAFPRTCAKCFWARKAPSPAANRVASWLT